MTFHCTSGNHEVSVHIQYNERECALCHIHHISLAQIEDGNCCKFGYDEEEKHCITCNICLLEYYTEDEVNADIYEECPSCIECSWTPLYPGEVRPMLHSFFERAKQNGWVDPRVRRRRR